MKYFLPLILIINMSCALAHQKAKPSSAVCSVNVVAMNSYKDLDNQNKWVMRNDEFELPKVWSTHDAYTNLVLKGAKGDGYQLHLYVFRDLKEMKKIISTDFIYYNGKDLKSASNRLANIIEEHNSYENLYLKITKNGKAVCKMEFPIAHHDHEE